MGETHRNTMWEKMNKEQTVQVSPATAGTMINIDTIACYKKWFHKY
jgi:hypothetical protein